MARMMNEVAKQIHFSSKRLVATGKMLARIQPYDHELQRQRSKMCNTTNSFLKVKKNLSN
jgi:hypothetical protein